MPEKKKQLVVVITCGLEDEKMSVAVFLASSAVDCVRKGAADKVHLNPLDPTLGEMIKNLTSRGGKILCCPPCAKVRGYTEDDLLPGVVVTGSGPIHELFKEGATALSF